MVKHLVFFRMKEKTPQSIQQLVDALRGLEEKIEEVEYLEVGVDFKETPNSYDVALITHFADRDALSTYAVHEDHLPVLELVNEICSGRAVVDFETEED